MILISDDCKADGCSHGPKLNIFCSCLYSISVFSFKYIKAFINVHNEKLKIQRCTNVNPI